MEDFLTKKKEATPILDLSKTVANSKEEFRRLLEKVPDFKIKPEKVPPEAVKIKEKKFTFKSRASSKRKKEKYSFMDPLPNEMKNLKMEDLISVPIDWKMLTNLRPKSKTEEALYSRMIDLGKLQNKSRTQEKRSDPMIRKTKNKSGIVEMRVVSCSSCGEDFCTGKTCCKCGYDSFARIPESLASTEKPTASSSVVAIKRKNNHKRSRSKTKRQKSPKKHRSKSRKNNST
ncbi:unnamed protein product [Phyllotreta striolata]|uniref:Uncharacterized protein n=1 Tax=Phyllotreta striolata TaxID=444603 RepID=A0A9N9XPG7_PHYSR|nr:unnamed protein product [Phyllotreta striolata]